MTTLTIGAKEYEIADEVLDLIVMISKERDSLKTALTTDRADGAKLACSDGLCKTPSIDEGELTPSQYIKSTDIDDEYDKLYVKHQITIAALKEIGNWPRVI